MTSENSDNSEQRKSDHLDLALSSRVGTEDLDQRFIYEPFLSGHPDLKRETSFPFVGKTLKNPIWISSMTGGTKEAARINRNLARVCHDFGLGMGLGSCRSLLESDRFFGDFDVREIIGPEYPLYANLGIAQLEYLIRDQQLQKISDLVGRLSADGLIVHVNPFQEWLQPEGDHITVSPVETITILLEKIDLPIIVKEVGQGFGIESMRALLKLPLTAIEFAASGGTNFSLLELSRNSEAKKSGFSDFANVGHAAEEMVTFYNLLLVEESFNILPEVIISGGVKNFLDGYYLMEKIQGPAVYGHASAFLSYARESYDALYDYVEMQIAGLKLARTYLRLRNS